MAIKVSFIGANTSAIKVIEKVCRNFIELELRTIELSKSSDSTTLDYLNFFDKCWTTARLEKGEDLNTSLVFLDRCRDKKIFSFHVMQLLLIGELRALDFYDVGIINIFPSALKLRIPGWLSFKIKILPPNILNILSFLLQKKKQTSLISKDLEKLQALYLACISRITHALKNGEYYRSPYLDISIPFFKKAVSCIKSDASVLKFSFLEELADKTLDIMKLKDLDEVNKLLPLLNEKWKAVYEKCLMVEKNIFKNGKEEIVK